MSEEWKPYPKDKYGNPITPYPPDLEEPEPHWCRGWTLFNTVAIGLVILAAAYLGLCVLCVLRI